jgi:dienelactone hydrolase
MRFARFTFAPLAALSLTASGAVAQSATTPKQLTSEDLAAWKTIRSTTLTPDGKLFAYVIAPNEGDGEVVVRPTGEGAERRFPIGEPPTPTFGGPPGSGGAAPATLTLSEDGRWLAFLAYPKAADAKKLKKEKKPVQSRAIVVNLATGESREFEKVRRFSFGGPKPRWIALQTYAPEAGGPAAGAAPGGGAGGAPGTPAPGRPEGSDLLLYELGTANVINVGNVGDHAFDESGEWLATTIDARDRLGNGIHLRNMRTDVSRVLESQNALYRRLQWADSGLAVSLLRGTIDSTGKDTTYAALGLSALGTATPRTTVVGADAAGFPAGHRISPDRAPTWARDHSALYFGIALKAPGPSKDRPDVKPAAGTPGAMQQRPPTTQDDEDLPTLVIWHGKEPRLQSMQQVQESQDKTFSYLASYRVAEGKLLRLATDSLRQVTVAPGDRWAIGTDTRAYELRGNLDGAMKRDVWVIDLVTGDKKLALSAQQYLSQPSAQGSRLLYYADGDYHVYDMTTSAKRNLTRGLPVSFVNVESDLNVDRPPIPPIGWARGGGSVLLSDGWDVWNVPVEGGSAVNLTGNGRAERIRYRQRVVSDPKERGIDLTKPQYFHSYAEWTKQSGFARVMPGRRGAERLLWDEAMFMVTKARDAEAFVYTRQTFTTYPDYWSAVGSFTAPRRLTDANPQQKDFAWSPGARLVDYVSDKGDTLQAALFLPAGYQQGKRYPTVVYIYEKLSQGLHRYSPPSETSQLNASVYTSRGYAVLMPDIVYRVNDPGMSAVWCVVPAVKAAIATGVVDSALVGLHGHSWGGYQTAFLITQTPIFRAAIAGAALTDMVSMYSSVYWNTGSANQPIFESSQGRFKGNFLDNTDAYVRNSPAFHANQVTTPLILLHNEKDGAVDFNQGITYFNTLRELGKDVVLLQYVGENHGLVQPKNQKDYTLRMREFFDHHLLGAEAPEWLQEGVPRLKMEEHLKSRQPKPKLVP